MSRTGARAALVLLLAAIGFAATPRFADAQTPSAGRPALDTATLESYGRALALGERASAFAAEIAAIDAARARGDDTAVRVGIQSLYVKAGRKLPFGADLAELLKKLPPRDTKTASPNGPSRPLGPDAPAGRADAGAPSTKAGGGRTIDLPLGEPPVAGSACSATPASSGPIKIGQLIGLWTDSSTGEQVELTKETVLSGSDGIELHGSHTWHGRLQGQRLTFTRKPLVEEMAQAPDWAKQQAYGKVEWTLELDVRNNCGELVLDGNWYPGSYKWSEQAGADPAVPPKRTVSDFGRGTPIPKKYTKPPPAISDTIVLTDQTAFVTGEVPKWPYSSASRDERVLFVYGPGLPRSWSEPIQFESDDPNVSYFAVALQAERDPGPLRKEQIETGWREARKNLDAATIQLINGFDAVLVHVRMKSGVLPGTKRFKLNGLDGSWRLRFGDDRASISFMRAITEDVADPTDALILPERVFIEVRTGADFPVPSIPLKLQLNDSAVTWNGAPTLAARKVAPAVYRTDTIELTEAGRPMPAAEKGVFFLPAHVKDTLHVKLEDPSLFGVTPPDTVARVLRTPAELGETWKEALLRAAKADGVPGLAPSISDWGRLSASEATEIANYSLTPIFLKSLEFATPLKFLRYVPKVYRFVEEVERGKLREKTVVTVGDHAALLLYRDQFIKSMTAALADLDQIKGETTLRGLREAVKLSAWDENSPWRYLKVSCPGSAGGGVASAASPASQSSGDCSFPLVVSDYYLGQHFGADKKAADQWVRQAVDEAIRNYRTAAQEAIAKAKGIKDSDVEGLMKLIGLSYQPLLRPLLARMMRLSEVGNPKRQLWIPDYNGRYTLRNLHTVVDALQAQEDYSKLDTQEAMLLASAATAPFMMGEGVIATAVAWGTDTAFLGVSLADDVPDFIQQREEVRFALGASILLGTQRLREAALKKTEWYQLLVQLGPAVLGPVLSTVRMVGVVRTSRVLNAIEREGLKALETLSAADKAAFWRYVTEAELLEELGETHALTRTHRRALAATDKLLGELGMKPPVLKKPSAVAAIGEAGQIPKTQTPPRAAEPSASTIGYTKEGEPAQVTSGEFVPLDKDPNRTPTLKPGNETADLKPPEQAPPPKPGDKTASVSGPEQGRAPKPGEPEPRSGGGTVQHGAGAPEEHGPGDFLAMAEPVEGGDFALRHDGRLIAVKLHKKLGEGGYAKAFVIVDSRIPGCARGCAIKIYDPGVADLFFGVGRDQVNYVKAGAAELGDDILQLKNLYYAPDAPRPYIIQELLGDDPEQWMYFSRDKFPNVSSTTAEFRKRPELGKAALELFAKLRNKGLVWEDCHVGNIFFRKIEGKWIAGILDQDRIIQWTADRKKLGNMGAWFGAAESHYMPQHVSSMQEFSARALFPDNVNRQGRRVDGFVRAGDEALEFYKTHPGPYFRDIDLFWEKSLERKHWLEFEGGQYRDGYLHPQDVERTFPLLNDPERLGPYDPGVEFNKPRQSSSLNVVPFGKASRFAARVPVREFKLAA